ncbi:hypothetical protein PVA45_06650 [Entomospira entomophila]|uniref:Uncharacterized protein n=1 Tax=Entomospira entomophila TaxID=2719988 RepID=A0A968GEW4_9SPIO|nr:hypothetical protein [Entomospira entomophilus]NIZ41179.1 hypothetical protein [Entomospira entomophilus]WDI35386.1 hypothetical protein PVA45_06650 [Entomospira entomophilus]
MEIDRSTRIYATTLISLAFFVLILTIITHFPYDKRQERYNTELMQYLIPDGIYMEHQLGVDSIIRRVILVKREVLASQYGAVSSEQEMLMDEYALILVLHVNQYGVPIKIAAKYTFTGELESFILMDDGAIRQSPLLQKIIELKVMNSVHVSSEEFFHGDQYLPIRMALQHGEDFIMKEVKEGFNVDAS